MDLHNPNNKLISALLEHFWCTNEPRTYTDSQDSAQPKLGGNHNHHLLPYNIMYDWPRGQHLNVILFWDSQVRGLEIPKIGTPNIWKAITSCADLRLRWSLKQSCIPCWDLSNDVWHDTYTYVFQGESWLLLVGNQSANLTPGPSFGHILCFKYSNMQVHFRHLSFKIFSMI
jgi:hypothetical protein